VTYFILVRTVDFSGEGHRRIDSASAVAFWHVVIFGLYLSWDIVTKILMDDLGDKWFTRTGHRMTPTLVCLGASVLLWREFEKSDAPHRLTADFALLWLVVLFRALKPFSSDVWADPDDWPRNNRGKHLAWAVVCAAGLAIGTLYTMYSWPLPDRIVQTIHATSPG
jgi:hypothetical protein